MAPKFTPILEYAHGGIEGVIQAMRLSEDPCIEAFLDQYDNASPSDRRALPLEAFALLADVNIPQLLGAIVLAISTRSANIIKVMLPTHHPATVRARIKNAMKPGGYRDRNAIDQAMRLLPAPKGTTIIFDTGRQQATVTQQDETLSPDDIDTEDLFPDLSQTQRLLSD